MTGGTRGIAAAFDAIAMTALAYTITGGSIADRAADVVLWGSAVAAIVAALVVLTSGSAVAAWAAIGYILFAAFLGAVRPIPLVALLALALMPIVPRPRDSLATGLFIAVVTAAVAAGIAHAV